MNPNEFIIETIKTLLGHLGVTYNDVMSIVDEKSGALRFAVTTPESTILIGESGARLLALNHLVKRIVEKKFPLERYPFMIDVNDYQKKHIEEICTKANMLAERARFFKSAVDMDPMSSYERMIVHSQFTDTSDIATESAGVGKDRHVVLRYTESKVLKPQ